MRTHELEGRKREEWVGEPGNMARHKQGLTNWKGGRGRSGLGSLETWSITNEESRAGGEGEGRGGWGTWKNRTWQRRGCVGEGREERGGVGGGGRARSRER